MAPTLRAQRLRWAWVLIVPYLLLSRPTTLHLLWGAVIALPGALLRVLAAGYIHKDRLLARSGPYAFLRHPLYLGSFFIGLGLAVASGSVPVLAGFLILFPWLYLRTIRAEEAELEERFGEAYRAYRRRVPPFFPLPAHKPVKGVDGEEFAPGEPEEPPPSIDGRPREIRRFQGEAFVRNRGWEAPLGLLAVLLLLWLRMRLFP